MEYTAAASCVLDFPIGKGGKSKTQAVMLNKAIDDL